MSTAGVGGPSATTRHDIIYAKPMQRKQDDDAVCTVRTTTKAEESSTQPPSTGTMTMQGTEGTGGIDAATQLDAACIAAANQAIGASASRPSNLPMNGIGV